MNGTNAFMNRMAYITPSGRPPHTRISTTIRPIPMPKIQAPPAVTGEVTMSVAMYIAPSISPPENSMNSGWGKRSGPIRCRTPENAATVRKMLSGIRQSRYLRRARYPPHRRISRPAVSPIEPAVDPIIRSHVFVPTPSNFMRPSGVAPVATSGARGAISGRARLSPLRAHQLSGRTGHVVMAVGNAAWRKARPSRAGLKMFCPSPPKISFPKPIPNTPPTNAIHRGKPGGRISPSNRPVITADPSRVADGGPNSRSVRTVPSVAALTTRRALGPK